MDRVNRYATLVVSHSQLTTVMHFASSVYGINGEWNNSTRLDMVSCDVVVAISLRLNVLKRSQLKSLCAFWEFFSRRTRSTLQILII